MTRTHPPASPHGLIQEVFDDVFFVTGSISMAPEVQISRNMIIVRDHGALTLIGSVRLDEHGLAQLDSIGSVNHVVNLGAYHLGANNGIDDPFYVERYNPKLWAFDGVTHKSELTTTDTLTAGGPLPFADARLFSYETSAMPEGLILLSAEGGILIAADSLQNWIATDEYFSDTATTALTQAGFIQPANVGPEWLRHCDPDPAEFTRVAALDFKHVLPSHGIPLLHTAKQAYINRFTELFGTA